MFKNVTTVRERARKAVDNKDERKNKQADRKGRRLLKKYARKGKAWGRKRKRQLKKDERNGVKPKPEIRDTSPRKDAKPYMPGIRPTEPNSKSKVMPGTKKKESAVLYGQPKTPATKKKNPTKADPSQTKGKHGGYLR